MNDCRVVWVNLYRSGWFHRIGKPGTMNMHAGDCYPTWEDAVKAAEPTSHYITTVAITVTADHELFWVNGQDSKPVPLSVSRGTVKV